MVSKSNITTNSAIITSSKGFMFCPICLSVYLSVCNFLSRPSFLRNVLQFLFSLSVTQSICLLALVSSIPLSSNLQYLLFLKNPILIRTSSQTIILFLNFLSYLKSLKVLLNLDLLNSLLPIISIIPTNLLTLSTTPLKLLCSTFTIIL